jgi:transposase InsO family protein
VLFDRICRENGIKHLLKAPRSPTTTGKVERWHRTLRAEFLTGKIFDSVARRPGAAGRLGGALQPRPAPPVDRDGGPVGTVPSRHRHPSGQSDAAADRAGRPDGAGRHPPVGRNGQISFAAASYRVGVWLAGQDVTVVCDGGLVQLSHRGVLIATHARRHDPDKQSASIRWGAKPPGKPAAKPTASAVSVTRKVDGSGNVCFAGTSYRAGSKYRRRQVQVAVVGDTVEISIAEQLIRVHQIRHDRTREHGALANPGGRPRRINAA